MTEHGWERDLRRRLERLTELEIRVYELWITRKLGFLAIGRQLGISDSEARKHFDNALDKLKRRDAA